MENTNFYFRWSRFVNHFSSDHHFNNRFFQICYLMVLCSFCGCYFGKQKSNFLLIALSVLLFFIVTLNPFQPAAIYLRWFVVLLIAYPYICSIRKMKQLCLMLKRIRKLSGKLKDWWFTNIFQSKVEAMRSLNVIRVFWEWHPPFRGGSHCNWDNVVIIRKGFGNTKIILPIDLELHLQINTSVWRSEVLGSPVRKMRNETIDIETAHYRDRTVL